MPNLETSEIIALIVFGFIALLLILSFFLESGVAYVSEEEMEQWEKEEEEKKKREAEDYVQLCTKSSKKLQKKGIYMSPEFYSWIVNSYCFYHKRCCINLGMPVDNEDLKYQVYRDLVRTKEIPELPDYPASDQQKEDYLQEWDDVFGIWFGGYLLRKERSSLVSEEAKLCRDVAHLKERKARLDEKISRVYKREDKN